MTAAIIADACSNSRSSAIPRACALDSRAGFGAQRVILGRKTVSATAFAMHARPNGTISKSYLITNTYDEISKAAACYLCNTHPKTGGVLSFEAVPLLRVQNASVIVNTRRRGASRGRPVLGGSLKSLAFSGCVRRREAAKR